MADAQMHSNEFDAKGNRGSTALMDLFRIIKYYWPSHAKKPHVKTSAEMIVADVEFPLTHRKIGFKTDKTTEYEGRIAKANTFNMWRQLNFGQRSFRTHATDRFGFDDEDYRTSPAIPCIT